MYEVIVIRKLFIGVRGCANARRFFCLPQNDSHGEAGIVVGELSIDYSNGNYNGFSFIIWEKTRF